MKLNFSIYTKSALLALASISACSQAPSPSVHSTIPSTSLVTPKLNPIKPDPVIIQKAKPAPTKVAPAPTPPPIVQNKIEAQLHQIKHQAIDFNLVSFDTREYQLEVADQPAGPGSLWPDSKTVGNKKQAVAVINAGFFTPEGNPLGLVIENTTKRGSYNSSSLGKGIYHTTASGAKITRSHQWKQILQTHPQHLLQTGPMLVEHSASTSGLSTKNSRPRSFIATDGKNHWVIGHASSCTLAQLGSALASLPKTKLSEINIKSAVNLDGGRSSDLWVSSHIQNGPLTIRPFWNKAVRNFLILKRK